MTNGYKYNLADLNATIGIVQMSRCEGLYQRRRNIAQYYRSRLSDCCWLDLPLPTAPRQHSWHLFMVTLRPNQLTIDRDRFVSLLEQRGIGVSVHYIPLHIMPYYQQQQHHRPQDFPQSYRRFQQTFSLPIYPQLTRRQMRCIADTIRDIGESHRKQAP